MKGQHITARVVIKYALLQVPGTLLLIAALVVVGRWLEIHRLLFWGALCGWVLKDIALFPFVWKSYDSRAGAPGYSMIGERGTAEQPLDPSGYIRVRGELWRAEKIGDGALVEPGDPVRICDVRGLTLLVEPANQADGFDDKGA